MARPGPAEDSDRVHDGEGQAHLQETSEVVMVDPGARGKRVRARSVGLEQPQGRFESGDGDEGKSGDPGRVTPAPCKIADEEKDEQVPAESRSEEHTSELQSLRQLVC